MTFDKLFNTFNSTLYYYCASVISGVSVLEHQKVSDEEKAAIDDCIKFCFRKLDEMGVTFKFQNSMLYIAKKIDCRSDYLINMIEKAISHAGGIENIYRRIE